MNRNTDFNNYLTFTKKDRLGIFCFLAVMLLIVLIPYFLSDQSSATLQPDDPYLFAAIDTLEERKFSARTSSYEPQANQFEPLKTADYRNGELFLFDPNTISATEWKRLGLNDRTVKTVLNYRSKGGKFFKKEDLRKIWGLPDGFYERVEKFISIENAAFVNHSNFEKRSIDGKRKMLIIDINESDTSAFIALPGIGSKLAARIVNFREKLGGFFTVDQIREVYGLPDSTFQKIKDNLRINTNEIRKININTATKDELKVHPYIKWNLANVIVEYRNQHGPFISIEDLKKIAIVDKTTFEKIQPYIALK